MHSKTNAQVTLYKAQLCFCEIITPSDEHPLYLLLQHKASMAAPIELMPTEKLFLTPCSPPPYTKLYLLIANTRKKVNRLLHHSCTCL